MTIPGIIIVFLTDAILAKCYVRGALCLCIHNALLPFRSSNKPTLNTIQTHRMIIVPVWKRLEEKVLFILQYWSLCCPPSVPCATSPDH